MDKIALTIYRKNGDVEQVDVDCDGHTITFPDTITLEQGDTFGWNDPIHYTLDELNT